MREKWETRVKSCGSRAPRVGDKGGRQVGDKYKIKRPEHPEWETSVGDKWETTVKSCGPERPEWETSVGGLRILTGGDEH